MYYFWVLKASRPVFQNGSRWLLLKIKVHNCVRLKPRQRTQVGAPIQKDWLKPDDTCFQFVTTRIIAKCVLALCVSQDFHITTCKELTINYLKKKIHVKRLYKITGRFQDFSGPVETLTINRQRLLVSRVTGRFSEERTGLKSNISSYGKKHSKAKKLPDFLESFPDFF